MTKRLVSFALILALALPIGLPAGFAPEAVALTTSNLAEEAHTFLQRTGATVVSVPGEFGTDRESAMKGIQSSRNDSWAYAAIAALNAAPRFDGASGTLGPFALPHLTNGSAGNRATVTNYLMRGTGGGPQPGDWGFTYTGENTTSNTKSWTPVSGVVYIPDLRTTATTADRNAHLSRIKRGVRDYGAVAASLYFSRSLLRSTADPAVWVYDNSAPASPNTVRNAPNHTVAVIGWNDGVSITYNYNVTTGTGDSAVTTPTPRTVVGAFLVCDSLNQTNGMGGGEPYWVSYDTILSNAYYIEGIYNVTGFTGAGTDFSVHTQRFENVNSSNVGTDPIRKNPLAHTYEYDPGGLNAVRTPGGAANTVFYANVFDVSQGASAIHAVSVFFPGEGNAYELYFINDYKGPESLNSLPSAVATGTKDLPGYYTIKLGSAPSIAAGRRFAVVAKVTSASGAAVPVQTPAPSAALGRSFFSANGTSWTDAFNQGSAAVNIKAHAERDVDILLTGIEIRDSEDKVISGTESPPPAVHNVDPGSTHALGPVLVPANANNVLHSETIWEMRADSYYLRCDRGFLVLKDGKPEEITTGGPFWLRWNPSWGMFIPVDANGAGIGGYRTPTRPGGITNSNMLGHTWNAATNRSEAVKDYLEQPFALTAPTNGATTLRVSRAQEYVDNGTAAATRLRVTVTPGVKDHKGTFINNGTSSNPNFAKGTSITREVRLQIVSTGIDRVEITRTELAMRVAAAANLTVRQLDSEDKPVSPAHTVKWHVFSTLAGAVGAKDATPPIATGFNPFDPRDPFKNGGPIATIESNGRITALREGTVFVVAQVGGEFSEPCEVTITGQPVTGVAVNRRRHTMSAGTKFTLAATVRPAAASNRGVNWSSSDTSVVSVDSITGVMTALKAGTATVTATTREGNRTAESVITVAAGPSAVIRIGRSSNYTTANTRDTVEWYLGEVKAENRIPDGKSTTFDAELRGNGVRMTATSPAH
jgi:hypothetical protein